MNAFQKKWKELAANRSITSSDMAVLALSKAIHEAERKQVDALELAKQYLQKSFKPITKPIKLDNGAYPYAALWDALYYIEHKRGNCQAYDAFTPLWSEGHRGKLLILRREIIGRYRQVNL